MIKLDTKKFTTMAIGLVVAVVLVSGLMVPVISSVSSESGGDLNKGEWYYKQTTDESNDLLDITQTENDVTISFNETPLKTISFGSEHWAIPLFICTSGGVEEIVSLVYSPELDINGDIVSGKIASVEDIYLNNDGGGGLSSPYSFQFVGRSVYQNGDIPTPVGDSDSCRMYMADKGEFVLCESPTVNAEQEIYAWASECDKVFEGDILNSYKRSISCGKGTSDQFQMYTSTSYGSWDVYPTDNYYWVDGIENVQLHTESAGDMVKVDDVTFDLIWSDNPAQPIACTTFIAPVGESEGGSGLSPTLTTLLSVIPLITVIGIIIGVIGYIRFKE